MKSDTPRFVSSECAKYLRKASAALDCAVQLCGDLELAHQIDELERRCDDLANLDRGQSDA